MTRPMAEERLFLYRKMKLIFTLFLLKEPRHLEVIFAKRCTYIVARVGVNVQVHRDASSCKARDLAIWSHEPCTISP